MISEKNDFIFQMNIHSFEKSLKNTLIEIRDKFTNISRRASKKDMQSFVFI